MSNLRKNKQIENSFELLENFKNACLEGSKLAVALSSPYAAQADVWASSRGIDLTKLWDAYLASGKWIVDTCNLEPVFAQVDVWARNIHSNELYQEYAGNIGVDALRVSIVAVGIFTGFSALAVPFILVPYAKAEEIAITVDEPCFDEELGVSGATSDECHLDLA